MPYKLKHSVRAESKEIVKLLLNAKTSKYADSKLQQAQVKLKFSSQNLETNESCCSEDDAEFNIIYTLDIQGWCSEKEQKQKRVYLAWAHENRK